jgi:transcriptional regulator with XRE-family HTH domain
LAYADEVVRIRRLAPLTERDIARATGASVPTVSAWLHRTRAPRGQRADRLVELAALVERLAAVLQPDYVPVWLNRPLAALGHRKPLEVIAGGGYEDVSRIVAGLEAPTFT